ncbi:MAG: DUF188 domain-containing protein [Bacillota bacterium]|nr:DUF188 domain-containing protein [Bacillota bacterium]MDW7729503.1 DUF188 domain-containing protein [Bacillota bacterium]
MKIIVDADACPKTVLQICLKLGRKYSVPVWTVASFNHNIESDHHLTVGSDSQEADLKVLNLAEKGDIAITQDWGLAAMLIGKQVRSLSPAGREYRPDNIDFMLEERELKARFRRAGGRTKGPRKRTKEDDRNFYNSLDLLLGGGPGVS